MIEERKKKAILEMFSSYPSFILNQEQTAISTSSYLQVLIGFEAVIVESACLACRKKQTPFPPAAGELFAECERQAIAAQKRADFDRIGCRQPKFQRLPPPPQHGATVEEMANFETIINGQKNPYSPNRAYVLRVDADKIPLRIPAGYPGAGQVVKYGYLTPMEVTYRWRRNR